MIINSLLIVDYKNEQANEFNFSEKTNIITSDETTIGKSSLLKSIFYALGFSIKQIPNGWNIGTMRFRLDVTIERANYYIIRDNSLFYVSDSNESLSLKEFAKWLENKLSIKMQLKLKKSPDDSLSSVYASEIITPFYLDQDKSWDGYLFKNSSDSLNRYSSIPQDLMEYVLGISNHEILDKENQKRGIDKEIKAKTSELEVLKKLQNEYSNKVKMMDTSLYDLDELKKTFENSIKYLSEVSNKTSLIKKEIVSKKQKQDMLLQDNIELSKILEANKKSYKGIETECIHCHSKLTTEQSLTRLKISNNIFEIQNLIEMNKKEINKLKDSIDSLIYDISNLNETYNNVEKQKEQLQNELQLQEYIQLESKRMANEEFISKINSVVINKDKLSEDKKSLEKEIRELKKNQKEKKKKINNRFLEVLKDINLKFGSDLIKNKNLFDFQEVKGSGMDKNKAILALYLTYIRLLIEFGVYSIPIGIDSFVKNEVESKTIEITFKELENHILSSDHQSFFVAIKDNLEYLSYLESYNVIHLKSPILDKNKYNNLIQFVEVDNL